MTVEFSGADAGVVFGRGLMTVASVSMTTKKINISDCDQRYSTINGSGVVFPIICGQIKRVTDMLELI